MWRLRNAVEYFSCKDGCVVFPYDRKIRNRTFLNQAFLRGVVAWNGVNFCRALEGCRLPTLCAGEPEPPAGHCCGYPSKPPATRHLWCTTSPWNETEIRWFCTFLITEIQQTIASPVKHTNNHDQPLRLGPLPFSNGNYVRLLQTKVVTADQGLISLPCCESSIIQSLSAGTLDLHQWHCDQTLPLCLF